MEGAGTFSSEGPRKKSKKHHKRKAHLHAENEDAQGIVTMPEYDNEAVLNRTGLDEAQSVPLKKSKKKRMALEDVKLQVLDSREKPQDNEQQRRSKKRKHMELEPCSVSLGEEKRGCVEDEIDEGPMLVQENGIVKENELKKPGDTTWVQTASWKSLVGETGRVTFSLGSMLGISSSGNTQSTSMGPPHSSMDVQSSSNVSAWIEGSSAPLFECSSQSNGHSSFSHVGNTSKLIKKSEKQIDSGPFDHQGCLERDPQKLEGTIHDNAEHLGHKKVVQSDHQNCVEKVCRFMRSENYEQEWLEAKRAVKDIFKRSRKDALRSMKMFHKKHNY